jgi:hypothetical protein
MVMLRPAPSTPAILAALLFSGLIPIATVAAAPQALDEARALLAQGRAASAVTFLEESLTFTPADCHAPLLDLLVEAYDAAATDAERHGHSGDAERYRDNREILIRRRAAVPLAIPAATPPREETPPIALRPPDPPPAIADDTTHRTWDVSPAASDLAAADAAFRARRYQEAGKLYAGLDRAQRLPATRRDHWAYCRWNDVVRRINARPETPQQWAEIDQEIERIRAISPHNWYGEYLRNRASERPAAGRVRRTNRVVVRGAAPEENPRPAPAPAPPRWQVLETPSFRIMHHDPELAARAAEVAEATRDAQIRRWTGAAPKGDWAPKCELYLYPTARAFSQMTGQPEESPGFSTMGMNAGRIIARRVNLRVDHPNLLRAILPHETTHVVLADLFPRQQIPRWADEGMAVLSEPPAEQQLRAVDLTRPLASGQLFPLRQLTAMDYPEGRYWGLYYAQSVSLTRFLVEQGDPSQFVQFVQGSQQNGLEAELRRVYHIDGFTDLENRWLVYAKGRSVETTATATRPDPRSESPSGESRTVRE